MSQKMVAITGKICYTNNVKKIYNIKKTTKERRKNLWDFSIN